MTDDNVLPTPAPAPTVGYDRLALAAGFAAKLGFTALVTRGIYLEYDRWLVKCAAKILYLTPEELRQRADFREVLYETVLCLSHAETCGLLNRIKNELHWANVQEANQMRAERRAHRLRARAEARRGMPPNTAR